MLNICEIFYSIQGESTFAGYPCWFIRLSGCNLRCKYCDTAYAYNEGEKLPQKIIIEKLKKHSCSLVEITGGEPLLQNEVIDLCYELINQKYQVLVETNGSQDISILPQGIIRIMDVKTPGSGEAQNNNWDNFKHLNAKDEIKFILTNRQDYDWAKALVNSENLPEICTIHFSPAYPYLEGFHLAKWILDDHLDVKLQLQLHKILNLDEK